MIYAPVPTNPYSTNTTATDPLRGLTHFLDALSDAGISLLIALVAFAIAAVCIQIWRSTQPEVTGMAVLGVLILVGGIVGFNKVADSYNTLDAATGGLIGKLFSMAFALLPLFLAFGAVWLLGRMFATRYL